MARILKKHGFWSWDADKIVHKLLSPHGKAFHQICSLFPESLSDGQIDRNKLGKIVFADQDKLKQLENILHPLVDEDRDHFLLWAKRNNQKVVLEIPLYFETNMHIEGFLILVTTAPLFIRKSRVLRRKGMTEDKFQGILKRQIPDCEKCAKADFVIQTGTSFGETCRQIKSLLGHF